MPRCLAGQTLLSGMGELHIEISTDKLKRQYNTPVEVGRMRVAHREAVMQEASASVRVPTAPCGPRA